MLGEVLLCAWHFAYIILLITKISYEHGIIMILLHIKTDECLMLYFAEDHAACDLRTKQIPVAYDTKGQEGP